MSSRDTATTPHPAAVIPDDTIDAADTWSMPGPVRRVYRFFISKRTGIGLIMAMAFLTLLGTVLAQSPQGVRDDPAAYADWLDSVRPRYAGWTQPLDALGLFDVFGSWWFKAVNVLLCVSILCCVMHRLPLLVKRATRPHLHVTEPFFAHARIHHDLTSPVPAQQAADAARAALRRERYRVLDDERGPGLNLYADKHRWMPFGTIFAHIAFVIILLGVLVTANTGFSDDNVPVAIGDRVDVGHGTGLQVAATRFQDTYYDDGRPKDYVSHLVLYRDGHKVAEHDTRVNSPLRYEGVKFFQASFGFAARVRVTDASGAVVYSGGVPLQFTTDDGKDSFGRVELPERGVDFYVITPASGQTDERIRPGEVAFKVVRGGTDTAVGQEVVPQGGTAHVGDLTYTFEREQQYTGLMVSDDPGAVWVWVGSTMILLGMTATMFWRHRRVWVRVHPTDDGGSRIKVASSERHDIAFEAAVERLVDGLRTDLSATPTATLAEAGTTTPVGA